jgi:hypothetical protein
MEEELKSSVDRVTTYHHVKEGYSLMFDFTNVTLSTSSYPYIHRKGNHAEVSIRMFQPEDMYRLADLIIKEANKIENHELVL